MPLNNNVPTNTNFLQGAQFLLGFTRLPYMNYFCTSVNFPGMSCHAATQATPFVDAPIPGQKLIYDPLEVKFIVDEQMWAYTSIVDWIKGYSMPDSFQEYKNLTLQQRLQLASSTMNRPQYSDAMLTVYTNKNNPTLQLNFKDVFPESIESINFSTDMSAEAIIQVKCTFRYTTWTINRLTGGNAIGSSQMGSGQ